MTSRLGRILLAGVFALGVGIAATANAAETRWAWSSRSAAFPGSTPWKPASRSKSKELGDDGFMVGPTSADPALQVRAIEDLIAQGVNVIGVVPNDATVLEPVLQEGARRRHQGHHA